MRVFYDTGLCGTVALVRNSQLHSVIERMVEQGFSGLMSIEGVGLLMFVEGGYVPILLYEGPVPDIMRVWTRPLSRPVLNLIFSMGEISRESIVYSNGTPETISLPSLGVEEQEVGISFLYSGNSHLRVVLTRWLQERYPHYRMVERDVEESSVVILGVEHLDRVVDLPPYVLRILILEKGEEVDRDRVQSLGIKIFEYPYTRTKFFRLLGEWDNLN